MITIEIHARDITEQLQKSCNSANSFEWLKQLRFKIVPDANESCKCFCEQTNTLQEYGFEYQGNNERLVVTALTDRCYLTLITAMHLKKGTKYSL